MWFMTANNQILELFYMRAFWIEQTEGIFKVFCKDQHETWLIGEFIDMQSAKHYFDGLYKQINEARK